MMFYREIKTTVVYDNNKELRTTKTTRNLGQSFLDPLGLLISHQERVAPQDHHCWPHKQKSAEICLAPLALLQWRH